MVNIVDLRMRYGNRVLFENINLSLDAGKRYGLIGANGAGKTTLLKILSGEIEPTDGDVNISKKRLEEIPLQINIVNGKFNCSYNKLTSLKVAPQKHDDLKCSYNNKLTTLEDIPEQFNTFICKSNKLTSLLS